MVMTVRRIRARKGDEMGGLRSGETMGTTRLRLIAQDGIEPLPDVPLPNPLDGRRAAADGLHDTGVGTALMCFEEDTGAGEDAGGVCAGMHQLLQTVALVGRELDVVAFDHGRLRGGGMPYPSPTCDLRQIFLDTSMLSPIMRTEMAPHRQEEGIDDAPPAIIPTSGS